MKRIAFIIFLIGTVLNGFSNEKIKGLSFVAASEAIDSTHFKSMLEVNANWVTLMPFGFIQNDEVLFNSKFQWHGETTAGVSDVIDLCRKSGFKIMLKPQIWIPNGFTGDFEAKNWKKFENSFRLFSLEFLKVAIDKNVEMFCIGTEWENFIAKRPKFWKALIGEIKSLYQGKLTYAANWDEFAKFPFWNLIDLIGIDAYFPLSSNAQINLKMLKSSWGRISEKLEIFSHSLNKPILFTEVGYRSISGCTIKPWDSKSNAEYSEEDQKLAYQALFETVWKEDWLEGLFIWKWHHDEKRLGNQNKRFTPQNKMAAEYLKDVWTNN